MIQVSTVPNMMLFRPAAETPSAFSISHLAWGMRGGRGGQAAGKGQWKGDGGSEVELVLR